MTMHLGNICTMSVVSTLLINEMVSTSMNLKGVHWEHSYSVRNACTENNGENVKRMKEKTMIFTSLFFQLYSLYKLT